jgi:twitching motility protein PilT
LVFSTLHTNNAAQTINRIIDSFPSGQQDQIRIQLAGSLTGIFSQRLIPRISGGLIPAFELLINNNAVANLIREKRIHEINTVIETSSRYYSGYRKTVMRNYGKRTVQQIYSKSIR